MNILMYWKAEEKYYDILCDSLKVDHCIYLYENPNDLKNQKKYTGIYIYEHIDNLLAETPPIIPIDEQILMMCRKFEPTAMAILNRWRRSISVDESFMNMRDYYIKYFSYWYNIIVNNNITLFLTFIEPHVPDTYFPYMICKAMNVPMILTSPSMSMIKGEKRRWYLERDLENLDYDFNERYEANINEYKNEKEVSLPGYLEQYFRMYSEKNEMVPRIIFNNEKKSFIYQMKRFYDRGMVYLRQGKGDILKKKISYYFTVERKSKKFLRMVEKYEEKPRNEQFFLFPLHFQPECTTLPKGGVFENQLLVIKMISDALPEEYYLYVKEHPTYWIQKNRFEGVFEARNKYFYDELNKLKNVRLIDHKINSLDLLDKCVAVVTINGTVGFEAFFKKKPVIFFGSVIYSFYKFAYSVRTNDECKRVVNEIISNPQPGELKDLRIYLKTIEPLIVLYGSDEKSDQDAGVPKPSDEDKMNYINRVYDFWKKNYAKEYCLKKSTD